MEEFKYADDLGPLKIIYVYEPSIQLKAILVVDNVAKGPSIGGLRMALRIPGRGYPKPSPDGNPGDLYVVLSTIKDPRFARRGENLLREQTIGISDSVLGTKLKVPTLENSVTVSVPPGTQPGSVLRIRGKGLPDFGDSKRGDLYVSLNVHVPEKLTSEEKKAYEHLRELEKKNK